MSSPARRGDALKLLVLVGILAAASMGLIYGKKLAYPPIRSDGLGYYLYLPAILLDRDVTFETTAARILGDNPPESAGLRRIAKTGHYLDKYPLGEAVLLSPFFALGHVLALVSGGETSGFSRSYEYSIALGGLVYFLAGLYYLFQVLRPVFSRQTVLVTLLVLTFGTNLFHYGTYDSVFSHAFSFFLFAFLLHHVERWYAGPSWRLTALVAMSAGFVTLVRPTNTLFLLYVLLFGITGWASARRRVSFLRENARYGLAAVALYGATLLPQLVYWKLVTDQWLVYSYTGESFDFLHPEIVNVLFSVRKGLFFWSPVLLLAVAGLLFLRRFKPELVLPTILFLPLNLFVTSSWHDWAYGGSFGHRAFIESIVVLAFGYAALLETSTNRRFKGAVIGLSSAFVLLSAFLMYEYWLRIVPIDETTWDMFTGFFTVSPLDLRP